MNTDPPWLSSGIEAAAKARAHWEYPHLAWERLGEEQRQAWRVNVAGTILAALPYIHAGFAGDAWPHYVSTYCIHQRHDRCRLTCKTCDGPCRCPCHSTAAAPAH